MDIDKIFQDHLIKITQEAAISVYPHLGKNNKIAADEAATNSMRTNLNKIDIKGKIVIARYGGNFRGYKAKFAEANGAAGLIIYTDPKDSGYTKGLVYPEGPYYNSSTIQRGSLLTTDFTGDPLTPFEPALPLDGKKKIKRLDPKDAQLHTIPVTPISYGEA